MSATPSRRSTRLSIKPPVTPVRDSPARTTRHTTRIPQRRPLNTSEDSSDSCPADSSMEAVEASIHKQFNKRSTPVKPECPHDPQPSTKRATPAKQKLPTERKATIPSRGKIATPELVATSTHRPRSRRVTTSRIELHRDSDGSSPEGPKGATSTPRTTRTTRRKAAAETPETCATPPRKGPIEEDRSSDLKLTPARALSLRPRREAKQTTTVPSSSAASKVKKPPPAALPAVKIGAFAHPSLPCRESQYDEIWSFLKAGVEERDSRCLYVSGVPGTGKTLVVKAVLSQMLQTSPDAFKYIFVNSLTLGTPERIWSRMHKALGLKATTGTKGGQMQAKVERFLESEHVPVILVVDELDQLLDKRQSILYSLLEWSSRPQLRFVLIAIFNTMNLPETALAARNSSRMGFNRVVFAPYTHQELGRIVTHHLGQARTDLLQDALLLLARKVAGISGDARRAIEIANRTLEIIEANGGTTGAKAIQDAFRELFSSPHIAALKALTKLEREVIRRLAAILQATGGDSTLLAHVVSGVQSAAPFEGHPKWTSDQILGAVSRLFASRLLLVETGRASLHALVTLGVAVEDVNYALGLHAPDKHED